jgi:flavin-dependent dehydrogenase
MNPIVSVISEGLVLLNKLVPEEAVRIQKRLDDYERKWLEEYAKGDLRDDALLDMLDDELRLIRGLFSTAVKAATSKG